MKHLIASVTIGACLLLSAGAVFAGPNGTSTGQPGSGAGNHCGLTNPNNLLLLTAPGPNAVPAGNASAFNGAPGNLGPNGQPLAGLRYAGSPFSSNTEGQEQSMAAVNGGQYDVACLNATQMP